MKVTISRLASEAIERKVTLTGNSDIMFDRFGDMKSTLEPFQKLYLPADGSRAICMPSMNIMSALSSENTPSFPKVLMDARKYKVMAAGIRSFTSISERLIPFMRDGKPILLGGDLTTDVDPKSGVYLHHSVARLAKGIPNPKVRPVLPAPWELTFTLVIRKNDVFTEQALANLIAQGGNAVGLGTFRQSEWGKFTITAWE